MIRERQSEFPLKTVGRRNRAHLKPKFTEYESEMFRQQTVATHARVFAIRVRILQHAFVEVHIQLAKET